VLGFSVEMRYYWENLRFFGKNWGKSVKKGRKSVKNRVSLSLILSTHPLSIVNPNVFFLLSLCLYCIDILLDCWGEMGVGLGRKWGVNKKEVL
jgi:hypothetical protein